MSDTLIVLLVFLANTIQAALGALVARRRGKSFWFWFGVCFCIFFPIGWICMLIYTRDDNPMTP